MRDYDRHNDPEADRMEALERADRIAEQTPLEPADCGWCGLSRPDGFGNRDLFEHPYCPIHGDAVA